MGSSDAACRADFPDPGTNPVLPAWGVQPQPRTAREIPTIALWLVNVSPRPDRLSPWEAHLIILLVD